jgi:hypothetical protein
VCVCVCDTIHATLMHGVYMQYLMCNETNECKIMQVADRFQMDFMLQRGLVSKEAN